MFGSCIRGAESVPVTGRGEVGCEDERVKLRFVLFNGEC